MPANGYSVSLGTASAVVVGMSADAQEVVLQNLEPASDQDEYARAGYLHLVWSKFSLTAGGTALFNIATAPEGLQIESYEIVSTSEPVFAELIEGATVTTTGNAIPTHNLNRTASDVVGSVFKAATVVSGGSAISAELITGSKQGGGGGGFFTKIHTLAGSDDYAMRFVNLTQQATDVFVQIIFSEKFNGQNTIWLGGSVDNGYRLRGGESAYLTMIQGQTLSAVAEESANLGVLKQD